MRLNGSVAKAVCITLLAVSASYQFAQGQTVPALPDPWITNNKVDYLTYGQGQVFLSGDFDWMGEPYHSGTVVFDNVLADQGYPKRTEYVYSAVSDGAGGWYVGGVGNIAHYKADKTVVELPVTGDGPFFSITKLGNTLYVAGGFDVVNGTARNDLAAIDITTGVLTSWNPSPNGSAYVVKESGGVIYAGGTFTTIGGQSRSKVAALDPVSGLATTWNANVASGSGSVLAIEADANAIYLGGSFSNVGAGAPSRTNFGAVNKTTGALLTLNPRPNDIVIALLLDGNTIYMSGRFSQLTGVSKLYAGAVDITTGALSPFSVGIGANQIVTLGVAGQKLFVGGSFQSINGQPQSRLAVVDKNTGILEPTLDRRLSNPVSVINVSAGNVLIGGYFNGISGQARLNGVVAVDDVLGHGTNFNPELPAAPPGFVIRETHIQYMEPNRLFYWQRISNHTTVLGLLDATTGASDPGWSVSVGGEVDAWAFSADTLFLAGDINTVNGDDAFGFAAVDLNTGTLLPWGTTFEPSYPDGQSITSMRVHNNSLYVAGYFELNDIGVDRRNLAAWDTKTGESLPWAPQLSIGTFEHAEIGAVDDNYVYIIGDALVRTDLINGDVDSWSVSFTNDGPVKDIFLKDTSVFIAGYFSPGLVRADRTTGAVAGWQPDLNDVFDLEESVRAIYVNDAKLFAAGSFSYTTDGDNRNNYAEYPLTFTLPPTIANPIRSVCSGDQVSFTVTYSIIAEAYSWEKLNTATATYEQLSDDAVYSGTSDGMLVIKGHPVGTDKYRCVLSTPDGDIPSVVATLTVKSVPAQPAVTLSGNPQLCAGEPAFLTGPSGFTYLWSNGETTQEITVTTPGIYSLRIADAGGCYSVSSVEFDLPDGICNRPPEISVTGLVGPVEGVLSQDLGAVLSDPDDNLDFSTLAIVSHPASGALASIDGEYILTIDYHGIAFSGTETITIEVCDDLGVCIQEILTIEVVGEIVVYNAISPNGDGKNESLLIAYIELLPDTRENKVTIFNRWGDVVFDVKNYDNSTRVFRGLNNHGNEVPSGTYFYRIDFAGGKQSQKGFIELKR